jgi:succinate dehydrogenase/fumarate reductase flavoprotein subunit
MVRENWPADQVLPKKLYRGAGYYAVGDGYRLAEFAGAQLRNMDRQEIFYSGIPDPRAPAGERALYAENPAAIWLGPNGRRFMNEKTDSKTLAAAINKLEPMNYWLFFDQRGSRKLNIRDINNQESAALRAEILSNPKITISAPTLEELAAKAGLPAYSLRTTVETWNRMVNLGEDYQFERFSQADKPGTIAPISDPPYYALRVYPLTRKSMGGPKINIYAQVMSTADVPIPGLYAAGELTGVAGINGKHGGSGTFLGPSVLTGRVAGKSAAAAARLNSAEPVRYTQPAQPTEEIIVGRAFGQAGYWHYDAVHRLVTARGYSCDRCHSGNLAEQTSDKPEVMLTRLTTCTSCH